MTFEHDNAILRDLSARSLSIEQVVFVEIFLNFQTH